MKNSTQKRALISTFAIFGSRIFGLIREQIFAFLFGASAVLDAYIVAFRIPNLLRDLLAEGALSQSFVTVFSKKLAKNQTEEAFALAHKIQTFIGSLVGLITILGIIFAPYIVNLLAHGFNGDKLNLTVSLTRIMMPYIFFVAIAAHAMGILYAFNKYFVPHSSSTVFNIVSISLGLFFVWLRAPDYLLGVLKHDTAVIADFVLAQKAIMAMAWGTLLGGVAQYFFQTPFLKKEGFSFSFDFNWKTPELFEVLKLTGPAILGGAAVQINVLVNTQFASTLTDGSVSWLNYAFRFMQFPLGIFGVAIATASAPTFAKLIGNNKLDDMRESIQSSIRLCLFLCLPATLGLIILGHPIVGLIYQHGRFNNFDTLMTAQALAAYAFGVTSYSLIKIYQPAFLAFGNSTTPMRVSLFSIFLNALMNALFLFAFKWGHWSLALGTSIIASVNFALLSLYFKKHLTGVWSKSLWFLFFKILVSSCVAGGLTFLFLDFTKNGFSLDTFGFLMQLLSSSLIFLAVYLGLSFLFKIEEFYLLVKKLRR